MTDSRPRILDELTSTIASRKANPSTKSYTTSLLSEGLPVIGAKIVEEAAELVEAAHEPGGDGRAHLVHEAADLVYHLLVLLAYKDLSLSDLEAELGARFGRSGLEEKASRKDRSES